PRRKRPKTSMDPVGSYGPTRDDPTASSASSGKPNLTQRGCLLEPRNCEAEEPRVRRTRPGNRSRKDVMKIEDTYEAGVAWALEHLQKPQSAHYYTNIRKFPHWFIE